ncbi:MAG: hypothetical protein AB4911_14820 [Oscillochloridaceae bacterium umkhey_bin13]
MSERIRTDSLHWANIAPEHVIDLLAKELYSPVSILGSQLKRLTDDEDPISEEEYEAIFGHMHSAVNHLSTIVVQLKRYAEDHKRAQG